MSTLTALTPQDLEKLQAQLPDYRLELVDGAVVIMTPSGYESDEIALEFGAELRNWVKPRRLGRVTGAGAGFILPNMDTRAPDVSFVKAERLRVSPRAYAELAPDLMVEVKSPSDRLQTLRDKIQAFLQAGTQIGILINPETQTLEVYRLEQPMQLLQGNETLTIPELLPGWQISIADLWPVEFN
jgi:Uma2 family endonuclease